MSEPTEKRVKRVRRRRSHGRPMPTRPDLKHREFEKKRTAFAYILLAVVCGVVLALLLNHI